MSLIKKIATVAAGTMMSRVFGFIREMLMAAALGTGPVADAFHAAFRFPNLFRRLFAEGAFNSAFIPIFSQEIEKSTEKARQFSEEVFGVLFSVLLLLTIIMELCMPFLVYRIIAPGFAENAEKFSATVKLASIMFPYLACMSLAAMMGGMLNALHRYFAAAVAPIFLNIILIGVLGWNWFTGKDVWYTGTSLSWGVMAAGVIQLLIVWVAVRNAGIRIGLRIPHFTANIRYLLFLALPTAITGGITQINLLINTGIASGESGAVSALVYADRLYQLPLGVIGIAIATVLLPELSNALRSGNSSQAIDLQNRSVEFALFLSLPAAAALLVMSTPVVRLLFEHGKFSENSTITVSGILAIYGLGLPAFILIKVFVPAFFARKDTRTPMIFAAISVFVNISLATTLFPHFSAKGIAIAETAAGWVNAMLLFVMLLQRGHWKSDFMLFRRIMTFLASTAIMALMLSLLVNYLSFPLSGSASLSTRIQTTATLVGIAIIIYFSIVFLAQGEKFSTIRQNITRKGKNRK